MNLLPIHNNYVWIKHFTKYEIKQNPTSTIISVKMSLPLVLNIIKIGTIWKEVAFVYMTKLVFYLTLKHIFKHNNHENTFYSWDQMNNTAQRFIVSWRKNSFTHKLFIVTWSIKQLAYFYLFNLVSLRSVNLIKISPFISLFFCFCRLWKTLTQPCSRHILVTKRPVIDWPIRRPLVNTSVQWGCQWYRLR